MQTAVSVKAALAFAAGVLLALGGAYTYFKISDARVEGAAIQTAAPAKSPEKHAIVPDAPPPAPVAEKAAPARAVAEPTPALLASATGEGTPAKPVKAVPLVMTKSKVTSRPVSLAVATPPPLPQQEPIPLPPPPVVPVVTPEVVTPAPPVAVAPPAPQPHTVMIPAGTPISVRLSEKISTDHNYSGDTFRAALDAPVVVDGFIIADRGAKVLGRIVKAQKAGKLEGAAELSLTLTEISTTDGQKMQVETNDSLRQGPAKTAQNLEKMGGGAALGAIIGAIAGGGKGAAIGAGAGGAAGTGAVLFGHTKAAVIDNETRLTFQLANSTMLTEKLN